MRFRVAQRLVISPFSIVCTMSELSKLRGRLSEAPCRILENWVGASPMHAVRMDKVDDQKLSDCEKGERGEMDARGSQ